MQLSTQTSPIVNRIVDVADVMVVAVVEKVAVVAVVTVVVKAVVEAVIAVVKAVVVATVAVKAVVVVVIAVVKAVAEVTVEVAVVVKVMMETNSREAVVVEVAVDAVEMLPPKRIHMHPLIAPTSEKAACRTKESAGMRGKVCCSYFTNVESNTDNSCHPRD